MKQFAFFLLCLALGGLIGWAGTPLLKTAVASAHLAELSRELGPALPALGFVAILFFAWLASAVHEAGHALAGRLVGFRFHFLIAGLLKIARDDNDRVRIGLARQVSPFGGMVSMLPTDTRDLRRRFFALIVAVQRKPCFRCGCSAPRTHEFHYTEMPLLLTMLGLMSLGIFLVTMVPMTSGLLMSDGKRMLRLARRNPDSEREAAQLSLIALATAGRRPRDWPLEFVAAAQGTADGSLGDYSGKMLAYYQALDLGDLVSARVQLEQPGAAARSSESVSASTTPRGGLLQRAGRQISGAGAAYLAQVPAGALSVPDYDRARVAAALARLAGQPGEAGDCTGSAGACARAFCLLARALAGARCRRGFGRTVGLTAGWLARPRNPCAGSS
jgi:hypothetical protein